MRNVYKILIGKPERKKLLRGLWHKWENMIKTYLKETGHGLHSPGSQ
jgi:hypothetical protein